ILGRVNRFDRLHQSGRVEVGLQWANFEHLLVEITFNLVVADFGGKLVAQTGANSLHTRLASDAGHSDQNWIQFSVHAVSPDLKLDQSWSDQVWSGFGRKRRESVTVSGTI